MGLIGARAPLGVRIVAALLVLAIGAVAASNAIGLALAARVPALALRYAPDNSAALAQLALRQLEPKPDRAKLAASRTLAQQAIRRDATNAAALGVIGLTTPRRATAARAMAQSEALSRRSLPTQLWQIEDAVLRNDVPGALRHYDVALRMSQSAPAALFPILVEAVRDRDLVTELARTLARRPPWGGLYLQQLAQSGSDLEGATALFVALEHRGIDPGDAATAALYARLIENRAFETAWRLYAAGNRGAARTGARNGDFASPRIGPAPFDWTVDDDASVTTRIDGGRLIFSTTASDGGAAVRQMLLLAPGRHKAAIVSGGVAQGADAPPYFNLTCAGSNAPIGRQPVSMRQGGVVRWTFDVPTGCGAQLLVLMIPPSSSISTIDGSIERIAID